jgi:hypothetical protein
VLLRGDVQVPPNQSLQPAPQSGAAKPGRLEVAKKRKRDIGAEILEGIRQLKRGEAGRSITVPSVTVPSVSETRARVGLS